MQSYDDNDGLIWFDGAMVPWKDTKVHVLTHGLHYASAVLRASVPTMAKSLNSRNTLNGLFIQPPLWVLNFLSLPKSSMRQTIKF